MIKLGKQYVTRDGRQVQIYATDRGGDYPVHGSVRNDNSTQWNPVSWTADGKRYAADESESWLDLIASRIKRERWVNIYDNGVTFHDTRAECDASANGRRIACVKIEIDCEHGEDCKVIRPMTPDEHTTRETIIDHSATAILAKLWATMYHLQDLVAISRGEIAGWSINYKGRLNHQPETNFASDIMSKLRRELADYPRAWDQHAVDAITPEHVSFDRELLNADVRARVETCLSVYWREVGMMQRAREAGQCDG